MARLMQDFPDLTHGRDEKPLAHAKADTAPGLHGGLLQRQASRQQPTTLVDKRKWY